MSMGGIYMIRTGCVGDEQPLELPSQAGRCWRTWVSRSEGARNIDGYSPVQRCTPSLSTRTKLWPGRPACMPLPRVSLAFSTSAICCRHDPQPAPSEKYRTTLWPRRSPRCTDLPAVSVRVKSGAALVAVDDDGREVSIMAVTTAAMTASTTPVTTRLRRRARRDCAFRTAASASRRWASPRWGAVLLVMVTFLTRWWCRGGGGLNPLRALPPVPAGEVQ